MVHKWVEKSQERWHMPIVPALRELRQEDFQEFKTISGYVSEKRLTRAMWWDSAFKKQKADPNRKRGRRRKRQRNCSKKCLGTVRITSSHGLELPFSELFPWANETVRWNQSCCCFSISPDYFITPCLLSFPSSKFRQTSASRRSSEFKWTWLGCQRSSWKHTHFPFAADRVQAEAETVNPHTE